MIIYAVHMHGHKYISVRYINMSASCMHVYADTVKTVSVSMWWICACTCVYVCIWWMQLCTSTHSMHTSYKTHMHIFLGNMNTQRKARHAWCICFEQCSSFLLWITQNHDEKKKNIFLTVLKLILPVHQEYQLMAMWLSKQRWWVNLGLSSGWRMREANTLIKIRKAHKNRRIREPSTAIKLQGPRNWC